MHIRSTLRTACVAAIAALAACVSATDAGPRLEGRFSGSWAGERFAGDGSAVIVNDSLYLNGGSPGGAMSPRVVEIRIADFDGPGEYTLEPGAGAVRYLLGGDVITGTYSIPPGATGTLVVTEVDGAEVVGRVEFEAAAQPNGQAPVGDRGVFEADFRGRVYLPLHGR